MITGKEIEQQIEYLEKAPGEDFTELFNRTGGYGMADRYNYDGHITVSAVIVHLRTDKVLLLRQADHGTWHFPCGHIDPRIESVSRAVAYMIWKTTGIEERKLVPVNVIGGIQRCAGIYSRIVPHDIKNKETAHYHHELRFIFGYKGYGEEININRCGFLDYMWADADGACPEEAPDSGLLNRWDKMIYEGIEKYAEDELRRGEYVSVPLGRYQYRYGLKYMEEENYRAAEEMFKKSVSFYKNTYDEDYETPPEIYNPAIQLANCYVAAGRKREAVEACLEALEISKSFRKFDGDNLYWHLELDIYIKVGKLYAEMGDEETALYYHEKAVEYLRDTENSRNER